MKLSNLTTDEKVDLILKAVYYPLVEKKAALKNKKQEAEEWADRVRIKLINKKKK